MKNKTEQIEGINSRDWDNFKSLKEFVEAEKLSVELQSKIHAFHESFLISKSYTIEDLSKMSNINWLYVDKHILFRNPNTTPYWSGDYAIFLMPFQINTKSRQNSYHPYMYMPDDIEKDFFNYINPEIIYLGMDETGSFQSTLKTREEAQLYCEQLNNKLRDKITDFVVYQKQQDIRFILNENNNPIAIHTGGCLFDIIENKNQLVVKTGTPSNKNVKQLRISGWNRKTNYWATSTIIFWECLFDISTNNLISISKR